MSAKNNLKFTPKPIEIVSLRLSSGTGYQLAIGAIQRIAAIRAYKSYGDCNDWMDKLSAAYIVAISTRSADALLMQYVQNNLNHKLSIQCARCKEASIGRSLIRERLFPKLKLLREHANKLINHLDDTENKGISELNIEGIFDYCYHLFQENVEALFGNFPECGGKFLYKKCKKCKVA